MAPFAERDSGVEGDAVGSVLGTARLVSGANSLVDVQLRLLKAHENGAQLRGADRE